MHCTSLLATTLLIAAATAHAAPSGGGFGGPGLGVGVGNPGFGYYGPTTGYNSYGGYGSGGSFVGGGGGLGGFGSFTAFQSNFFAAKLAEHEKTIRELVDFQQHREVNDVSLVKKKEAKERDVATAVVKDNRSSVGDRGFGGIGFGI